MQAETLFHREIETPLGLAVLAADTTGLAGFYFSDQRDCPIALDQRRTQRISNPQAREHEGTMLRRYRVLTRSGNTDKALRHPLYTKVNWQRGVAAEDASRAQRANGSLPDSVLSYFEQTMEELDAYFRGRLTRFSVPLSLKGTPFQVKVWKALAKLPEDQLISYSELGRTAGVSPGAYRAVGVAVGRNPVSIIVPCHRVVAADARLTGYGGGLERKVALLEHEGFQLR